MNARTDAIRQIAQSHPDHQPPATEIDTIFGCDVFSLDILQKRLPKPVFRMLKATIARGERLDPDIADTVACAMKDWAISKGATHYTHWFQPMTGLTAEKHDAFLTPTGEGRVINEFSGKMLICGEPDASSFPSGGLRSTFEARGYTAWDPTVPAFIIGRTLHVPTLFYSYSGEALDRKIPLMRSISALSRQALRILRLFGNDTATFVRPSVGPEQEYFLVDRRLAALRPDLLLAGRTLMGTPPAKGQEMEDHYFGSIPARVMAFMQDVEDALFRLGIPAKTRHNEVAPNQFECAPIFEEANLAVDHNQLLMSTMKKVARRHNFRVLLHEKPYKGVNGSGKHNNWSLLTNTGVNLLSPGKNPKSNMQFLVFLVSTIKAVYEYGDLLKASIVSQGNEARLGGDEAPPVIMSVFLGNYLSEMLDELVEKVSDRKMSPDEKTELKLNVGKIPEIMLDNTDRNRTSPFAFTGNRFEFRAVGSSANCGGPMIVLNAAVAEQLIAFKKETDTLIDKGVKKDEAIFQVLRKYIIESRPVRFEGNGYSKEWREEAARRGLSTEMDCIPALKAYCSEKAKRLFVDNGILSERELEARFEIKNEIYLKKLQIESRVLGDLVLNHIIPTAITYQNTLLANVTALKNILPEDGAVADVQIEAIRTISRHIREIQTMVVDMTEARKQANAIADEVVRAEEYTRNVRPYLEKIRYHVDKLELLVDDEIWPLPKYRELLFSR